MPSATAWRARSSLDQWVMCRPLATGSRQASRTIWARWRGGNPGGAPGRVRRGQQAGQPRVLVAAAGPPDGRGIVLRLDGQELDRFPGGDAQDDPSPLDLVPGEGPLRAISCKIGASCGSDRQGARLSSTHGATPVAGPRYGIQRTGRPEFLALLRARDTRTWSRFKSTGGSRFVGLVSAMIRGFSVTLLHEFANADGRPLFVARSLAFTCSSPAGSSSRRPRR